MFKVKFFYLLLLLFVMPAAYTQALHQQYSTLNGFQDYIYTIREGPSGAIYFSTENGVYRFHKDSMTYYETNIPIDEIIIQPKEDKLYLSTLEEGNILELDLNTKKYTELKQPINDVYRAIIKSKHHFITSASSSSFMLFDIKDNETTNHSTYYTYLKDNKLGLSKSITQENKVDTRIQLEAGDLYVMEGMRLFTNKRDLKGIYKINKDNSITLAYPEMADKVINGFLIEDDKTIFISADSIFIKDDYGQMSTYQIPFKKNGFDTEVPYRLEVVDDNKIVFLTHEQYQFNTKLFLYDLKTQKLQSIADILNLKTENISSFRVDKEKNIWVGTAGAGIFKIINLQKNFVKQHFYSGSGVYKALSNRNSHCVFLLQNEIKHRYRNKKERTLIIEEFANSIFLDYDKDNTERVYTLIKHASYSESEKTIYKKLNYNTNKRQFEYVYGDNLYKVDNQTVLYEDDTKIVLVNKLTDSLESFQKPNHFHSLNITRIKNNLFFLNAYSVQVFNLKQKAFINHPLNNFSYTNLAPYKNETYLATTENSVLILDKDFKVKRMLRLSNLCYINGIYIDNDDFIWVTQEKGLYVLNHKLDVFREIKNLDYNSGANSIGFHDVSPKNPNDLYVLTTNGAYILDRKILLNIEPPLDFIKKVADTESALVFKVSQSTPNVMQFQYAIDGGEWQTFSDKTIDKAGLMHGIHSISFQYLAKSGIWKPFKTVTFFVHIPWYKRLVITIPLGMLLFVIMGFGVWRYLEIKKQQDEKMLSLIEVKQNLERKIRRIQNTFAMDLHDNFGNRLSGIKSSHSILNELRSRDDYNSPSFSKFLNHMDKAVDALLHDVKDLMWVNNQDNNTAFKLSERIKNIIELFNVSQDINIVFVRRIETDFELPYLWNRHILFIVKECINNAIKYSKAQTVTVKMYAKVNSLYLVCRDDGVGFELENLKRFSGLEHIKARAEEINCQLDIISKQNIGTTIEFTGDVPLEKFMAN